MNWDYYNWHDESSIYFCHTCGTFHSAGTSCSKEQEATLERIKKAMKIVQINHGDVYALKHKNLPETAVVFCESSSTQEDLCKREAKNKFGYTNVLLGRPEDWCGKAHKSSWWLELDQFLGNVFQESKPKEKETMNSGLLPQKPTKVKKSKVKDTIMAIVLDASGSMQSHLYNTVNNFNEFIQQQKTLEIPAKVSLLKFNDSNEFIYESKNIKEVNQMSYSEYNPNGGTALFDAIGRAVNSLQSELDRRKKAKKGQPKVLVLILTDGEENSSKEYGQFTIKSLIESKQATENWTFVYMGANQNAILNAAKMAIPAGNSINFCASNIGGLTRQLQHSNSIYRSSVETKTSSYFSGKEKI